MLEMEVGIRKRAWQRAWRYPAYLWSLRWVYAVKKPRRLVYADNTPYTRVYLLGRHLCCSCTKRFAVYFLFAKQQQLRTISGVECTSVCLLSLENSCKIAVNSPRSSVYSPVFAVLARRCSSSVCVDSSNNLWTRRWLPWLIVWVRMTHSQSVGCGMPRPVRCSIYVMVGWVMAKLTDIVDVRVAWTIVNWKVYSFSSSFPFSWKGLCATLQRSRNSEW